AHVSTASRTTSLTVLRFDQRYSSTASRRSAGMVPVIGAFFVSVLLGAGFLSACQFLHLESHVMQNDTPWDAFGQQLPCESVLASVVVEAHLFRNACGQSCNVCLIPVSRLPVK